MKNRCRNSILEFRKKIESAKENRSDLIMSDRADSAYLKWRGLNNILTRSSSFGNETGSLPNGVFNPSSNLLAEIRQNSKVLVIGAGGLGCELLKDLALSGFSDIHVIDMDTIATSNLNRQFLFRHKDVGRFKAEVAAEFIMKRVPGCMVTHHTKRIQEMEEDFYKQFKVIIGGLDNIEARRWLNSLLHSFVIVVKDEDGSEGFSEDSILIPYIDGGTEGFSGQARVILPRITSCFECSMELFPPQTTFAICTIANTPRLPEHCIMFALLIEWKDNFAYNVDSDNPVHMQWIYERALARADNYKISGVTYFKTMGVVKNIIPAVASTNALISAVCVSECIKIITFCSQSLNNYFMHVGRIGINATTICYEKRDTCAVCSTETIVRQLNPSLTLQEFRDELINSPLLQLKRPDVRNNSRNITMYMHVMKATHSNLEKTMQEFAEDGDELIINDPTLVSHMYIKVKF